MDRTLTVILGFVAAGVALLLGVALVLTIRSSGEEPFDVSFTPLRPTISPIEHDPAAATALIEAWAEWRTGTFVTAGTWTRTVDARPDDPLIGDVLLVQDPPRRQVVRLGSMTTDIDDPQRFERLVVSELGLVGGYVVGNGRLYDVARVSDGCFQAELVVPSLASPWGRWAQYCFDDESGALVSARVRRQSAFDVEQSVVITTTVTDADFARS